MATVLSFYDLKEKVKVLLEVEEVKEINNRRIAFATTKDGRRLSRFLKKDQVVELDG